MLGRRRRRVYWGRSHQVKAGSVDTFCVCVCSAGGVCPTVDPDVLPVPCSPLLHHLVRPLPPLHRHHRRAAADAHHHGDQLDDHRRAAAHLRGEFQMQTSLLGKKLWIVSIYLMRSKTFMLGIDCLLTSFISQPW